MENEQEKDPGSQQLPITPARGKTNSPPPREVIKIPAVHEKIAARRKAARVKASLTD